MKKIFLITLSAIIVIGVSSFGILSDNGRAGATGSPGETTCATSGCHTSFTVNTGAGSIYLTSDIPNWNYTPGQTYTVNAIVKYTGRSLFGIGVEALTSANANAGTLVITNSAKTQIKTRTINGVSRNNVVHQLNGGSSSDSCVFSFNWVAPSTNIGNVKFYFAGIAANGNGSESGDYVYNSSKIVSPATATGIVSVDKSNSSLKVINLSGSSLLHLSYEANTTNNVTAEIYDIKGSLINAQDFGKQNGGNVELNMDINNIFKTGIYIVKVIHGSQVLTKKTLLTF